MEKGRGFEVRWWRYSLGLGIFHWDFLERVKEEEVLGSNEWGIKSDPHRMCMFVFVCILGIVEWFYTLKMWRKSVFSFCVMMILVLRILDLLNIFGWPNSARAWPAQLNFFFKYTIRIDLIVLWEKSGRLNCDFLCKILHVLITWVQTQI